MIGNKNVHLALFHIVFIRAFAAYSFWMDKASPIISKDYERV